MDVIQGLAPLCAAVLVVAVGEVTAEAVAAVHRAAPGDNEQDPPTILVEDACARVRVALLAGRVSAEAGRVVQFLARRQYLQQQWVTRVPRAHPGHKAAWHLEWKVGAGRLAECQVFGLQAQQREQFGGGSNNVAQLLTPVLRGVDAPRLFWYARGRIIVRGGHASVRGGRAGCRTACPPPGRANAAACRPGSAVWVPWPSRRSVRRCR